LRSVEFGAFLRARRQSLGSAEVVLPAGRRHGGCLRREEVANLAGVSHSWYTRLEQGANVRPTREVVDAIGHALRLDDVERAYLRHLAGFSEDAATKAQTPDDADTADLQELVDQFLPNPAVVVNDLFDYLAWNDAYVSLFELDPGTIDPAHRNLLWAAFALEPVCPETDDLATRLVANFRWYSASRVGDPEFALLNEDLSSVSDAFRKLWQRGLVGDSTRHCRFEHPRAGPINMKATWLALGHVSAVLEVKTPITAEDRSRLATIL
jgi:transcriptional regulator with XRE-family HTH domain